MSSLRLVSIILAIGGTFMLQGAAPPPIYPPRTLILFVASWCAPCRGELRQIDTIAAAASPLDVRVTPVDRSNATAAMLRDVLPMHIWRSARAVNAFAQQTGGLPFSVMTDADGEPCATNDRALNAAAVQAMRRRCSENTPTT